MAEDDIGVSRETMQRLEHFVQLLKKWNPKINLVSKSTIAGVWARHIFDSKQIYDAAPEGSSWVDLGSGGGFPGLIIACLAFEDRPALRMTLIESDQRKCAFLRTVSRELDLNTTIIAGRIENVPSQNAEILSARALAELPLLLTYATRHLQSDGVALFPKGQNWKTELESAQQGWSFSYDAIKSQIEAGSVILRIKAPRHAQKTDVQNTPNHRNGESKRRGGKNDDNN